MNEPMMRIDPEADGTARRGFAAPGPAFPGGGAATGKPAEERFRQWLGLRARPAPAG